MIAYCYRSGQIEFHYGFGRKTPEGAIWIGEGRGPQFRRKVEGRARLAYDNKTLLVPGIPEANNDAEALKALSRFVDRLK